MSKWLTIKPPTIEVLGGRRLPSVPGRASFVTVGNCGEVDGPALRTDSDPKRAHSRDHSLTHLRLARRSAGRIGIRRHLLMPMATPAAGGCNRTRRRGWRRRMIDVLEILRNRGTGKCRGRRVDQNTARDGRVRLRENRRYAGSRSRRYYENKPVHRVILCFFDGYGPTRWANAGPVELPCDVRPSPFGDPIAWRWRRSV